MIKIIPQLIDPDWVSRHACEFEKLFADKPSTRQSGIHIKDVPNYDDFRWSLYGFLQPLNLGHWLADYCSIRSQPPNVAARGLPWHQDSAVVLGRTFGYIRGTVVWIPFTPINSSTPTIEVAHSRWPVMHRGNKETGYLEAIHQVKRDWSETTVIGNMNLGDVLLFDINHLHRTWIVGGMSKTRISADLRFTKHVPWSYHGKIIG